MAHRNRWFTELKNGGFSMAMLNNQMVYDYDELLHYYIVSHMFVHH
jgi:hypothetical protein